MLWPKPANMSAEVDLEWLLKVIPRAEAKLYRVLLQLIPAPGAESTNAASRQIEMAELARLTGYSKRWVNELMQRIEKNNFIRTDGGRGSVKWIRLLPLGVPLLGRSKGDQPAQQAAERAPSPGKAKAPRAAAPRPERRQETVPSPKADADISVLPPVEKPAEIIGRRRKASMPSIPPANPAAPGNPVVLANMTIPSPPVPADPTLPAAMVPPPPASEASGTPVAGIPVVPAVMEIPPSSKAPAIPAKPIPPAPPPRPGAPIKDLVAYVCSLPVTSDLIWSLKKPAGNEHRLRIALEILCRRQRRFALESDLRSAIRSALNDYL
jgi:hypothetical protein